jgi:hypothetical protein
MGGRGLLPACSMLKRTKRDLWLWVKPALQNFQQLRTYFVTIHSWEPVGVVVEGHLPVLFRAFAQNEPSSVKKIANQY